MLRVHNFSVSVDGYGAGPAQTLKDPLGVGGERMHEWVFRTRYGREMIGEAGGSEGLDHELLVRGFEGVGASIMGRNMFGPVRGSWASDPDWTGWWGPNPPYHHPVFVLTHEPRESLEMEGGTVFHFVTDGIESALDQANTAANGLDVRLNGGVSTVRQYLAKGLVDELHVAIAPVLLGAGERLLGDLGTIVNDFTTVEYRPSEHAAHMILRK